MNKERVQELISELIKEIEGNDELRPATISVSPISKLSFSMMDNPQPKAKINNAAVEWIFESNEIPGSESATRSVFTGPIVAQTESEEKPELSD